MPQQFNNLPNYPVPLETGKNTTKDWYLFFAGLFRGLAPAKENPVVLGASPHSYTAPARGFLILTGGTVTAVEFSRDGVTFYNYGTTVGQFQVSAADIVRVTYAVLPTVLFVPT